MWDAGTPHRPTRSPIPAALVIFCLLTPIVAIGEESLFRVYVQTRLTGIPARAAGPAGGPGAVLFAASTATHLALRWSCGRLGLVLAISYQANGKIPRLVIAHTLWNLVAALW